MTVLLDLDDTLIPTAIHYHQAKVAVVEAVLPAVPDRSATVLMEDLDALDVARSEIHGFHRTRFPESLAQFVLTTTNDRDLAQWAYDIGTRAVHAPAILFPWVIPTLRILRPHVRLHLVTKGDSHVQYEKIQTTGLARWIHGWSIVPRKTPQIYQEMLQTLHLTPETTVMVGDSLRDDIHAPQACGLHAIHVRTPKPHWGYEYLTPTTDHQIPDISHLPQTLQQIFEGLKIETP